MRYLDVDTAPKISRIGLGTWQFGAREWGYGEGYAGQEAKEIVHRAIDLGVTLFDTAEIYGFGRSERIRRAERRRRPVPADHQPVRGPGDGPGPAPALSQAIWQNGTR